MICNNNYLTDILRVFEIKDLTWVMRFQSHKVYYKVDVVIQFTVFKHRQMIYASIWTNEDVSVFAIVYIIYKM